MYECPELDFKPEDHDISSKKGRWTLISSYLHHRGFVRQHIDSYNNLVNVELQKILEANRTITLENDPHLVLTYKALWVGKPCLKKTFDREADTISPNECRLRELTYAAPIFARVQYTVPAATAPSGYSTVTKVLTIGWLPVMLRSNICVLNNKTPLELVALQECPLDPGGYFIIRGVEKVVLTHEQLSKNRIIVERDPHGLVAVSCTSSTHTSKSLTTFVVRAGRIYLKHNSFSSLIPIVILFKAMGVVSDQQIVSLVGADSELHATMLRCLQEAHHAPGPTRGSTVAVTTQRDALEWLVPRLRQGGNRSEQSLAHRTDDVANLLANVVVAHIPVVKWDFSRKVAYCALMVRRLLLALRDPSLLDDKDFVGNKRLELAGQLLGLLFEDAFKIFNRRVAASATAARGKQRTRPFDFADHMHFDVIKTQLINALASGNVKIDRFHIERAGVSQVLTRTSYISALGMMTRVNSQFEKTRKISGPRALQPSQIGVMCPSDTPEGEGCGLVKNLALLAQATDETDHEQEQHIRRIMHDLGVEPLGTALGSELHMHYLVMFNGELLGITRRPIEFVQDFKLLRRDGRIRMFTHIYVSNQQSCVYVSADGGRMCRPLIIVDNSGKPRVLPEHIRAISLGFLRFEDLIHLGAVEYVDVHEENDAYIAVETKDIIPGETTHLELEAFAILGVCAGLVPYPHHNQSPRITYQCQMGKQSMGIIAWNQQTRIDTVLYTLSYPQRPLCGTHTGDLVRYEELPGGSNASVAVMAYSGYDIEDAVILNSASLDRGFARCHLFKKFVLMIKRSTGPGERIMPRSRLEQQCPQLLEQAAYKHIGRDGIVSPGSFVINGDVLIARFTPAVAEDGDSSRVPLRPSPMRYSGPVGGHVDKVLVTLVDSETLLVKILIRQTRRPELGDKFSSRHGQKGVCGLIVPQVDLPFSEDGICPDVVMNPHGFPSRMTVGKLLEMIASHAAALDGKFRYGTAFGGDPVAETSEVLVRAGLNYGGKKLLMSGQSGELLAAYVFFGPIYYQKLKHMVLDKMHARARGKQSALTHQPLEGRARGGGLRVGEMERDCIVAYGAASLVNERLMLSSDAFVVDICGRCGVIGFHNAVGCRCADCLAGRTSSCARERCPQCPRTECRTCRSSAEMYPVSMPYACKLLFQEMIAMSIVPRVKLEGCATAKK